MKKIIIANWKLNPSTLAEAQKLIAAILPSKNYTVIICPPSMFLLDLTYPLLGAQDAFWKDSGPYTGQISPEALSEAGIKYCIVGHSERRSLGETDEQVSAKVGALLAHGITPVLCVGFGTTVELDDLEVTDVLKGQLIQALAGVDASRVVVAYEPVWAISLGNPYATKKIATPEHAEKIAIFIKTKYQVGSVLYGGSVNAQNSKSFLEQPTIDGLLVGGASLKPEEFNKIIMTNI